MGLNKKRKKINFIFPVMVCALFCCYSFAGTINISNFKHLSTENGLSQKSIRTIFQDSDGIIWMGTQEGLNRYDGIKFTHFRYSKSDITSLSSDVIRDILEDSNRNLWVATSGGLNRFDRQSETFERVPIKDKTNKSVLRLNTLFEDIDGKILIGTDGKGIFSFDPKIKPYVVAHDEFLSQLTKMDIRVIFKDSRDRYWIGTDGNGIWVSAKNGKPRTHFVHDEKIAASLSHNRIRSILEDQKGQIWIGTRGGGLDRFEELSKTFEHYRFEKNNETSLSNDRVYKIFEDTKGNLWIGTDLGVSIYRLETNDFKRVEHLASQKYSLTHNRVLDIYEDDGGIIWIGTLSGLNLWNPVTAKFVHYQHISERAKSLSNDTVSSFAENYNNGIFISTFGGGLNLFDTNSLTISPIKKTRNFNLHDSRLTTLLYDSQRRLWVGSATSGIRLFDPQLNVIADYRHSKDNDNTVSADGITDIYEDSDGDIWIATYGAGLNRYDQLTASFKRYRYSEVGKNSLSSDNIYQISEGDEGYIWLATDGGGISRLDKHTDEIISFKASSNKDNSLSSDTAWSIFQDSVGRFWIGTQGNGLNRWEPEDRRRKLNKFKHYTVENGLPSSTVNGVLEDNEGYIWISTNKGVSKLEPNNDQFEHYNLADEVHHNEFIQGALIKSKDGRIYIGGTGGISAFYPNEITSNAHIPPVVLTDISSENKSLRFEKALTELEHVNFSYKDYLITFEFAALDYAQPDRNQYQYKLEGFDPDWIQNNNLNRATYTNLPSGTYIFKVKGSNNDGVWSNESINLMVTIEPAPWVSWWAFVIYTILFCVLLILIIRSQAKRIANQELFQQQVADKVESKTAAFEKDNMSLKEQVKNYQHNSGNDLATGLPNQSFFTEQLLVSLAWLKNLTSQNNEEQKLCCIIMQLSCDNDNIENELAKLAEKISSQEDDVHLIARWNTNEIAMLSFVQTNKQATELINRLSNYSEIESTNNMEKISLGYSLVPLHQNDEQSFKWENILMLTEHAMRSASKQESSFFIGLLASYQKLSPTLIKSVMTNESVLEMGDVFDMDFKDK